MTETPDTTKSPFSTGYVEELTYALSKMAVHDHLPREQWSLLLAIFTAAAGRVEVSGDETEGTSSAAEGEGGRVNEEPENKEIEALRNQLLKAYTPGPAPGPPDGDMVSP